MTNGDNINPAWPVAAVFDDFGAPSVGLEQQVTLAPNIASDYRSALILALIVGGVLLWLGRD